MTMTGIDEVKGFKEALDRFIKDYETLNETEEIKVRWLEQPAVNSGYMEVAGVAGTMYTDIFAFIYKVKDHIVQLYHTNGLLTYCSAQYVTVSTYYHGKKQNTMNINKYIFEECV